MILPSYAGIIKPQAAAFVGIDDPFDNSSLNSTYWETALPFGLTQNTNITIVETSALRIHVPTTQQNWNGIASKLSYNFAQRSAYVKIASVGNASANFFARFAVVQDINNYFEFQKTGTAIFMRSRIGGTIVDTSIAYNATDTRALRFRNDLAGGNFYFETAPLDLSAWTVKRTISGFSMDMSGAKLYIFVGATASISNSSLFFDFNDFKLA